MSVLTQPTRKSRLLFHWRSNLGLTTSVNGAAAVFTQATGNSLIDSMGTTYAVVSNQAPWTWEDVDGDGVYERPRVKWGTGDLCYWPFYALPQALTIYLKMRALTATSSGTATHGLVYIGNAVDSGARLELLHATGVAGYSVLHSNGVGTVSSGTVTGAAVNDEVELMVTLTSGGVVQVTQSIASATATVSTASGSLALGSAWSDTRLYVNSVGTSFAGTQTYESLKIAKGNQTMATMRSLF